MTSFTKLLAKIGGVCFKVVPRCKLLKLDFEFKKITTEPLFNYHTFLCTTDEEKKHKPKQSSDLHFSPMSAEGSLLFQRLIKLVPVTNAGAFYNAQPRETRLNVYVFCQGPCQGDTFRDILELFQQCDLLNYYALY